MTDRDQELDSPLSASASASASEPDSPSMSLASPTSPTTPDVASPTSPQSPPSLEPPRLSPRSVSASAASGGMTPSSTPLGGISAARRPAPPPPSLSNRAGGLNVSQDLQARMKAFHLNRQGAPPAGRQPGVAPKESPGGLLSPTGPAPSGGVAAGGPPPMASPAGGGLAGGVPASFRMPPGGKPAFTHFQSSPAVPNARMSGTKPSLAEKRGMAAPTGLRGPPAPNGGAPAGGRKKPGLTLSQMNGGPDKPASAEAAVSAPPKQETMMDKYAEYLDKATGSLRFKGKAVLDSKGVQFSGGRSFSISLDEVDTLDELGRGNYGTVYKVRHSRPKIRRPGLGLAGNKLSTASLPVTPASPPTHNGDMTHEPSPGSAQGAGTTGVIMAMKEIHLELDDAKFAAIIMELDILHRCVSPFIIDFYGAFFQEGAVYICMEFMDGGSIDKLYGDGIPESVLRKITLATTKGLKALKDDHNIIHRDVKPTNILVNSRGQVKICDFGVSGNLVASIAKTNIGCQSYMAPERISSGGVAQAGANPGGGTYSVQSDIWSLGLSIIECALGRYPYPPETYNNIFSQLSAIVDGDPPDLPTEGYSDAARNFVSGCLNKIPKLRPTYAMLLEHAWLAPLNKPAPIAEEDEDAEEEAEAQRLAAPAGDSTEKREPSPRSPPRAPALSLPTSVVDEEVAGWVVGALERRRTGKMGKSERPALHAAPLDAVSSPAAVA